MHHGDCISGIYEQGRSAAGHSYGGGMLTEEFLDYFAELHVEAYEQACHLMCKLSAAARAEEGPCVAIWRHEKIVYRTAIVQM